MQNIKITFLNNLKIRILNLFRISDFGFRIYQDGFTLVELIVYLALVSIFISGAILFAWDVIYGREKAYQNQIVEQNARSAMARIAYEIRRANDINSLASSSIELENGANDTTINLVSDTVRITTEGAGPFDLTSNQVEVTDLSFTDLTSTDNNTKDIEVSLTCQQASSILSGQEVAAVTITQSVELNSQFNQCRALLMDTTNVELQAGDKRIEGTTLEDSGPADITIDKITVSWIGGHVDSVLDDIIIDGSTVWSGSASSGDLLDITDTTLITSAAAVDIDRFGFTRTMADSIVTVSYTMADSSTCAVEMTFAEPAASPSPSPSVSPSPSPSPATCDQYCTGQGYSGGTCKKSKDCGGVEAPSDYECSPSNICCCE